MEAAKQQDPDREAKQKSIKESEDLENFIQKTQEEAGFTPGINNFSTSLEHNPFQIKWDFYCQARSDWQRRLDKIFPEVMGLSTKANVLILQTLFAFVGLYFLHAISTVVFYKYSLIIRYQLIITAGIISYCAGTVWGNGIGNKFLTKRLRTSPPRALCAMVLGASLSLWGACFDYNLGYNMMNATCLYSIGILYWMRHRGLIHYWKIKWLVPILGACVVSQMVAQYRAVGVKANAATAVEDSDIGDYLSVTSVVKAFVPKWVNEVLFSHETETDD